MGQARLAWLLAVAVLGLLSRPEIGHADAIDGNWCAEDGRVMTIEGSSIVTPGGQDTTGDYSRHAFAYVVPAGEADAGGAISMVLLNHQTLSLRAGDATAEEIWRRCDVTS